MIPTPRFQPNAQQAQALADLLPRIEARARRLASDPDDARDLAQDVALKLWHVMQSGTMIDDLPRYAMITLRHMATSRWRRAMPHEEFDDQSASIAPDAPARLACAEACAAIDRLPNDQARLMRGVLEGESSPEALAKALHIPTGTAMSRLSRARAALRKDLGMDKLSDLL